jgi:hypothetical protein
MQLSGSAVSDWGRHVKHDMRSGFVGWMAAKCGYLLHMLAGLRWQFRLSNWQKELPAEWQY